MKRVAWLIVVATATVLTIQIPANGQIGGKTPADARVRRALQQTELKFDTDKDGDYRLHFTFEDKRTQLAFIRSRTSEWGNMEIREVFALGYKGQSRLSQAMLEKLLKDNAVKKSGAWELLEQNGTYAAVFSVKVSADCDSAALETVVRGVAVSADEMEKALTGTDDL